MREETIGEVISGQEINVKKPPLLSNRNGKNKRNKLGFPKEIRGGGRLWFFFPFYFDKKL